MIFGASTTADLVVFRSFSDGQDLLARSLRGLDARLLTNRGVWMVKCAACDPSMSLRPYWALVGGLIPLLAWQTAKL